MDPYPDSNGEHACIVTNKEIPTQAAPEPEGAGSNIFKDIFDFF